MIENNQDFADEEQCPESKNLTDLELDRINNIILERKLLNTESSIIAQKIECKKKDIRLLELQIELLKRDINDFSSQISNKSQLDNDLKSKYSEYIKLLTEKYNLPDKWGFHPETGEIVVD